MSVTAGTGRVLALWVPDWPAVAAALDAGVDRHEPLAVLSAGRVIACSSAARGEGIRRGMRKRESQARCPRLVVADRDVARDARHFEPITGALADTVSGVETLRPGLLVLPERGAARYHGSPEQAAERLTEEVSALGVDCQIGAADEMSTAVVAAFRGARVPAGGGAAFLASLPIAELAREPSLCSADRDEFIDLLWRLGLRTVGAFAALSRREVAGRFGPDAVLAHRMARAEPERPPSPVPADVDLAVEQRCDPPLTQVDVAAFVGRALAVRLHEGLAAAGAACTRLAVTAITDRGTEHPRVWRCVRPLTPEATADRVRWQLDGLLTGRGGSLDGPVAALRLEPVEVVPASALQWGLWGGEGEGAERARRALTRVQGVLGPDAVRVPVRSGGRAASGQITLTRFGDEPLPERDPAAPWPGRLPAPAPSVLVEARVRLLDATGESVDVTDRGAFTGEPVEVTWGSRHYDISWWAGPWLSEERWWAGESARARAQLLLAERGALLVRYAGDGWTVEGLYE